MKETTYMKETFCTDVLMKGKNVVRLHIGSLRKMDAPLHGYAPLFLTRLPTITPTCREIV